jgi:Ca2+-transporting ATPase
VAFTTLAAFQWFHAMNARSQYESVFSIGLGSNRWLLIGIAAAILLQIGVVHTGLGQTLFGTTPLSWADWGLIVLVSGAIWVADEVRKWLSGSRRLRASRRLGQN